MTNTLTEVKEYEAQYFGFTPFGIMNFYFNCLVESWRKTVDEMLLPRLLELSHKPVKPETVKALRAKLVSRLFQHGRLEVILNEAQSYMSRYILTIPHDVTLPGDEDKIVKEYDEEKLLARIEQLSKNIVSLQIRLKEAEAKKQTREVRSTLAKCLAAPEFDHVRQLLDENAESSCDRRPTDLLVNNASMEF